MKRLSVLIILMLAGCGRPAAEKKETAAAPLRETPTSAGDVIDGVTGRSAVRTGMKAQQKLREIGAKENRELNEVLDEK